MSSNLAETLQFDDIYYSKVTSQRFMVQRSLSDRSPFSREEP